MTGTAGVEDFPTTAGAYQLDYPSGFVSELNAGGSALVYSTFLGGALELTYPTDIAIEPGCASACDAFVTGYTGEDDLSVTLPIQSFNATWVNGVEGDNVFVTELNATGTAAVYSTYIGGTTGESTAYTAHSPAIAVDASGDAYVVGETSSANFPVTLTATPYRSTFALEIGATAAATAVVYPLTLAFPTTQPMGVASAPLVVNLQNLGSNAMPITSITPSPASYTETNTCGTSLAGGGECAITVTFTPATATSIPGTLTIVQGGNNSPNKVTLTGTGVSQPFLTLSPTSLTFDNQPVDTASPYQTVTVGNSAPTSLTLSSPAFTVYGNFAQTNNCPASLAHNATCTVNIAFLPTENGLLTGQLSVNSNTSSLVPFTYVALSGNGVVGAPTLTLNSAGLVFNPQDVGTTSAVQYMSVTNTGNVPVSIFGSSITGAAYTDYTATNCFNTNLNPGGTCNVKVIFDPTATGTRAATVTMADSTTVGTHSFTVTGTGVAQTLTLSITPPTVPFAALGVGGASTAFPVVVTNTGDASVVIERVYTTGNFRLNSTGCVTTLRAGYGCTTQVEFTPLAAGALTGSLIFEDSATGSPQSVTLTGTGLVAAAAAITTPDSLDFGTQANGTTTPTALTVILDNVGNVPLDVSKLSFAGTDPGDFQISYQDCLATIVVPGRNCEVQVTFTPVAAGARGPATLNFTDAAGTQTVNLTGTGVAATEALNLTPTTLTFEAQQKGVQSPYQNVWLINTGTAAVTPSAIVSASTDYEVSGCVGTAIQPNTSCELYVYFTPTVTTADNSTLKVTSNATGSPQTITLNGTGAAAAAVMELAPSGLAFTSQVISTASAAQYVEVTNTSAAAVAGITITTAGTNAAYFTISSNSCAATLAAATSCSFYVSFKPTAAGEATASVSVKYTGGSESVALAGFGVAAASSALLLQSALQFPSETLTFPSPNQTATLENTGNSPLTISSIVLGGSDPGDFTMSPCSITNPLAAGSNCNISVSFTPTVAGSRSATVTITYTGATGSPAVITLSGMGVAASQSLAVGPATITFPPQVVSTTSTLSPYVLLTNTGTSPVTISSIALAGDSDFTISSQGCPISPSTLQQGPISNTCAVYVSFTPTAAGARTATVTVTDSAPGSPTKITLNGTGVAETKVLTVTPTTLAFGPQVTATTSSTLQYITVTNTGNFTVTFTNVTITGNYALASQGCTGAIAPGSACSIGVSFTPTSAGAKTGTVTITSNATVAAPKVNLSGTGIATTSDILLSQTAVVFDAQTVGVTGTLPQLVYYYNQGNTTVTISSFALGGTNPGDFSLSGSSCTAGGQVPALSYCYFRILFTAAAAGARSATLSIVDTDPGGAAPGRVINLSGTGISSSVPEVGLYPTSLTFASTAEGSSSAPQNITLTNNGSAKLTISSTGIAFTGTDPGDYSQTNNCPVSPATLAAGFSCNIAITFSPKGTGARPANLTLTDSATPSPQSATLTGTGVAGAVGVVTLSPTSLAFGNVALGTPSELPITVKNTGTASLTFASPSVAITGTVSSDFSQTNTCTGALAAAASCTIMVTFKPTTIESQTGTVTITDNATNSPQLVPITGTGAEAAVDLSPSALAFPSTVEDTTSAPLTITVENYGDANLTPITVSVTGPFVISAKTCVAPLAPGLTCTISVEFSPKAAGAFAGAVTIIDNAGDSPQQIELSGTGTS